ncbi:hypothetical protein AB0L05_24875 [Nonomuraea pusilla]|uniref:hypothetical protein n=1 Tax=Nonomuraea pusilla TaxID=46177 RepID=UPI0033258961
MWRFGLRGRMAASYVLVTATAVLLVETVLVLAYLAPRASGDDLMSMVREQASADAKVLSLAVSGAARTGPNGTCWPGPTSGAPAWTGAGRCGARDRGVPTHPLPRSFPRRRRPPPPR